MVPSCSYGSQIIFGSATEDISYRFIRCRNGSVLLLWVTDRTYISCIKCIIYKKWFYLALMNHRSYLDQLQKTHHTAALDVKMAPSCSYESQIILRSAALNIQYIKKDSALLLWMHHIAAIDVKMVLPCSYGSQTCVDQPPEIRCCSPECSIRSSISIRTCWSSDEILDCSIYNSMFLSGLFLYTMNQKSQLL